MSSLYEQELNKANEFRLERERQEAEAEQARLQAEIEQRQNEEAQAASIPLMIGNVVIMVIMSVCVIYLLGGAFINARRELKGQPKKKRTSMIIFVLAIMVICYIVFYTINPR